MAVTDCGAGLGSGCRAAGVCYIRVSVCVHVWTGAERRARPLLCHRLHAVVSTALFTSATSIAYIASITATTLISPNNDNVLEQFGGVEANSLCRLLNTNLHQDHIADELDVMQLSSYYDDDGLNKLFNDKSDSFSILGLNCQCLNAKFDQINIMVQQLKSKGYEFDAICLQETWLSDDSDISLYQIQGYNLISQGKICSEHGGLAIYVSTKLNFNVINMNINSQIWEGQFIEISNMEPNKLIIIGNVYRPPNNTNDIYQTFTNEFTPILENLQNKNREVIIAGDYNIDLLKINDNPTFGNYFNSLVAQSFFPQITLPTRFSDRNCTIIDNFLCRLTNHFLPPTSGILVSRISDHFPYFIFLDSLKVKRIKAPKTIQIQIWNAECIHQFNTELNNANIYDSLDNSLATDPTQNLNILNYAISQAKRKHIPSRIVKFNKHKHKKSTWITNGIIRSISYRDKLYLELKRLPSDSERHANLKVNLKTYQSILRRLIRDTKKCYYQHQFDKFKNDIKNTWGTIKQILNRTRSKENLPEAFLIDNVMTSDHTIIANKFNTFFANVGFKLAENITDADNTNFRDYLLNPSMHNLTFELISEATTMETLNNLKSKPSCGHDGISTKLLKACKLEICKPLTLIINQMLTTGIFPDDLKVAKVIPLFKKGKKEVLDNYRPISLLPSLSKIFERVIFNQIHAYFTAHDLYYSGQYGFREKHSTQLAALELVDRITRDLDIGNTPISIFIDLSKAFDTLDHNILLSKLHYYGINGAALQLLRSYLSNRKQFVQLGDVISLKTDILMGVPQGSILGPLLFIIYINDMVHSSESFKFINFADDTTLITKISINDSINDELAKFYNWLKANKLSLNVNKTKAIAFHMPQKIIQLPLLQIAGTNIEFVDNFNFLGLTINKHLTWTSHINILSAKISKTIGILNSLKHFLPIDILRTIYNSLIVCHLNYGILLWGTQLAENDKLHKLQKKAVRIITSNSYLSHSEPLFKQLCLLKSCDIYKCQLLKFIFKLMHKQLPQYFTQIQFIFNNQQHHHNTRTGQNVFVQRVNHEFAKRNIIQYRAGLTYNTTPSNIIEKLYSHSFEGFSVYIKRLTIQSYNGMCTVANCYSCRRNNTI